MLLEIRKCIPLKIPCMLLFAAFVSFYVMGSLYWIFTQNILNHRNFLETFKCQVCYGNSACKKLSNNRVSLIGYSRISNLGFSTSKNIYHAEDVQEGSSLVFKKLAKHHTFNDLDAKICSEANMNVGCDVASSILQTILVRNMASEKTFAKYLQGTSPMFVCPSTRLLNRLIKNYREKVAPDKLAMGDKIQMWTSAMVNAESLMLQTFQSSEGWPFPKYFGACGRYIIVENGGQPLSSFFDEPWSIRVDLAYQLMKIAEILTNNKEDFALYMTDVTYDNFVVDTAGKVSLVDLEDIVVVDKQAVKSAKPDGWEELHESTFTECPKQTFKSCHSFSETQLCSHVTSDHNYYAICRYILSKYSDDYEKGQGRGEGLLHDIPDAAKNEWDLEYLLYECVTPTRQRGRIQVVHKLLEALDNLRQKYK